MNISELSIRRPVLATVLTIIILLFGFIGYNYLGVREYPSVDNPIISVSCSYPGANADVIENQITEPLEQNINGIPGIRSLSSVSQQGQSRITVEFELSVDLETAANDVRDKVSRAQRYLPRDCDPPTVSKADADATPILMVALQSDKRSLLELSEIADLTVKEQLQTISDVSSVSIWGEKRYSMRLWLDPIKMSGYGITPLDVKNAVDNENVELPSGSIEGNTTGLSIRTLGLMHTAEEFNNLILKEDGNRIVRFSDIGRAELGPADIKSYMKMNGVPMVGVVVIPQPGANHIEIANAVYDRMEKMKKDLPEDVHYNYGFDNTKFIRASIDEVKQTVYEAFVLVIIIIFLFLRDWRVTLVPCIVIPVSLIGAFFVMYLAGFSINVLSMLAVVMLTFGGLMVANGEMTVGTLLNFTVYLTMLVGPLDFLSWVSNWWARCVDSAQRVFEIVDAKPEIVEKEHPIEIGEVRGDIEISKLEFEYEPAQPVIKNLDLKVNAGQMLGIVGKTGAGKTTIANLIARLYDPKAGCVKIDGVDVRDLPLDTIRKNVGLVSQDIYLFIGTIADNIRYAKPDATMDEIIAAAKAASAHDFIMKLPDAYETRVGAGGHDLSGGERQRISIARTIIQNPRILILDEATAAMDTETERNIQYSLTKLMQGRTTVAIAHRLSTLRDADMLAVISEGEVVEYGSYAELLKKRGEFYKLYKIQAEALKAVGIID